MRPFTLGSISAASSLSLKFTPYLFFVCYYLPYLLEQTPRRLFHFRDPSAAFIRGRRLFGAAFIQHFIQH